MRQKGTKYPFIISNTDRSDKAGKHWLSILKPIQKKDIFLFNPFCSPGLKNFINQDHKKLINRILFDLKKFKLTDDKLTLTKTTLLRTNFEELTKKTEKAMYMTRGLFHFIEDFRKLHVRGNIHRKSKQTHVGYFCCISTRSHLAQGHAVQY